MYVFTALTISAFFAVLIMVPQPYMDEIFHVPQAMHYLDGNFSTYDPKITTPPGLYFSSLLCAVLPPFNPVMLRGVNIVFGLMTYHCLRNFFQSDFQASIGSMLPFMWFFNHLFYTDSGATFFSLFAVYNSLHSNNFKSGLMCIPGLLFRQTNLIWTFYAASIIVVSSLKKFSFSSDESLKPFFEPASSFLEELSFRSFLSVGKNLLKTCLCFQFIKNVIVNCSLHLLCLIAFMTFVFWNGSVALGDKENHAVTVHLAQIPYFFLFVFLFSPFRFLPTYHQLTKLLNRKMLVAFSLLLPLVYWCVHYHADPHPFLLADNRHFTFYLWKKLLNRNQETKLALVPCYSACVILVVRKLAKTLNIIQLICLLASIFIVLSATPLFEFRYFIVPSLLVYVSCKPEPSLEKMQSFFDLTLYAVVNGLTMYLFLYCPFKWPSEPGKLQRFMW
ncbi:putative Dol-P-Glc:Glc(2)Man(9)GlcNAc(2)-PP-Dol alpha-1,2-glucosyltransferase [Symsagittifera roscoffensis]|uniref:putative Dol-P-Glc:Glc(2)Man(9)GlcNAc(2)-PP-Dol alpha-1,2-glucosyltransferase n=1 Tax=Symsagittifera roscoffensis TaxID=84072 RepID=UPI00307B3E74